MFALAPSPFLPATKADWLRQVQRDLKDDLALECLRWHTPDGFVIEPYYTVVEPPILAALQKPVPGWLNAPQPTLTDNAKTDNTTLRNALTNGADALVLAVRDTTDLTRLLDGIKLSASPVFFRVQGGLSIIELITNLKRIAPYQLKGGLLLDPVAMPRFLPTELAEMTRLTLDSPRFGTVCADGSTFHNAGATATQELAFALGSLAEQYDVLTDNHLTMSQLVSKTIVSISVGTSYFLEISKLRALRILWQRFLSHYTSVATDRSINHYTLFVHCQTSEFYEETASPYTNMLRATTEAMAAVIGGCDALTVRPYDAKTGNVSGQEADFSARIARNISSLLSHEANFGAVADPAAGSYYVETLTKQLTESAWALFLEVENQGGLARAIKSGFMADELDRSFRANHDAIASGERVIVGVTKFQE
jgi:methylmalonyl-CoA mutase